MRDLPDNAAAIELITATTVGAFRLELEAFLSQQPNRDHTQWNDIRTHMLSCFGVQTSRSTTAACFLR